MAEFSKIAHDFLRMCGYYNAPPCQGCPMGIYGIDLDTCRARLLDNPEKYEMKITQWAKEHPEPNYPTWIEWLQSLGVIPYLSGYVAKRDDDGNYLDGHVNVNEVAHKPIPVDIAQKLGIEPKER